MVSFMADVENKPKNRKKWIIENVTSLGMALILVLMIRSSIIEAFKIPSGSMIPTLLVGDHIFVNKFAYGFKIPFSDFFGDEPIHVIKREPPKRGDIIVFKYPKDESLYYIKRVVGIPGDVIEIRDKRLIINGQPLPAESVSEDAGKPLNDAIEDSHYDPKDFSLVREATGDESRIVMNDNTTYMLTHFGPETVPEGQYFAMGDNRDHSNDSRFWGFVPLRNIKGKAIIIWASMWFDFSSPEFIFRVNRIGKLLD